MGLFLRGQIDFVQYDPLYKFSAVNGAILLPRGLMIPLKSDVDTEKQEQRIPIS